MDKLINHKNNCMSIVWNGCTIYAVAFYENSVGLSVNFEFPCTGPQTVVTLYLIQEELNLKEDDKILEDENYNIYILHSNGEKKEINSKCVALCQYHFEKDDSYSPNQRYCNKLISDIKKETYNENEARILLYKAIANDFIKHNIYYYDNVLRLTTFMGKACLWITDANQMLLPHIQFVGGYPNEYCAFLDDLTEKDERHLFYWNKKTTTIEELKKIISK